MSTPSNNNNAQAKKPNQPTENPNQKAVDTNASQKSEANTSVENKPAQDKPLKKSPTETVTRKPKPKKKFKKFKNILLFLFLVLVPWLLIIYYVTNIAHPRYISTADVVVKQVSDTTPTSATGITALLGVDSTSAEDARYLKEYILSNDMVKKLDTSFKFKEAYHVDGTDFIYELPEDATQEDLLEYFKDRVRISLDEQTYVLTVTTEGFNPEYALELNKAILGESEQFVNRISQQIATDQLQYAQTQLSDAQKKLEVSKNKLLNYQNTNEIFDPKANAQMINQLIGNLQAQLSSLRTEERQLLSYLNPDAPQIVSIRSQIQAVEKQISEEQAKLTSRKTSKLNLQTLQFETIKSEVDFATELYKLSLSSMEKARLEAFRKMKNLIVISTPYKAEEALYPRAQYIIWTSLAFLLIFYGFVRLVVAVVKDHSN